MSRKSLKHHLRVEKTKDGIFLSIFHAFKFALLIFQLMVFQMPHSYAQSQEAMTGTPSGPKSIDEQKAECAADGARRWDPEINSCVVKNEVMETKNDALECQGTDNPEKCYADKATEQTGVASGDAFQSKGAEAIAARVSAAYSLFALITALGNFDNLTETTKNDLKRHNKESKGSCTSKSIFMATSAAWTVGDLFLKKRAKKNFKKLAENYKKEVTNEHQKGGEAGSYQAQVRAFHYLREEQEQVKKQATNRRNLQLAMVAGFAASLGFAIYEVSPPGMAAGAGCMKYGADEAEALNKGGEAAAKVDGFMNQLGNMGTSAQVLVGSGIMLALNAYLIFHANNEKERAEKNISAIDYMLETFSQYAAGICPDGRDDLRNERCYCYTEDGEQNSNRSNSVICQNLYKADNINYALLNPSLKPLQDGPRQGCLTVTGQFDEDCKCRQMINNVTKQNACAKTPNSIALSSGLGTQLGAGQAVSSLNQFPQGANKAIASLNGASLNKQAARSKKLVDSMLEQARAKGVKVPGKDDFEKMADQLSLAQTRALASNPKKFNDASMISNPTNLRPASMNKSLALAEKRAGVVTKPLMTLSKATGDVGPSGKSGDFKFNWNDQAASEGNKVQTFMDKNYKYKDSDIVKRDDVSLWNVISKRYQTSGLKRLFGEEDE